MVVLVNVPDVPVMVTGNVPVAAVLVAVSANVLVDVAGFGLNAAVTPLGRPDAFMVTLPLKPFCAVIVMLVCPLPPCAIFTLAGDADSVKFGVTVTPLLLINTESVVEE